MMPSPRVALRIEVRTRQHIPNSLDNPMDQLPAAGLAVTNDIDNIDAYTWTSVPAPRRSGGRHGG